MEDPIHSLGSTRRTRRRRSNAGRNTASTNPSAQETKDGPKQANSGKRRGKDDRDLEGAERDQRIAKTS
jgi:hypothetical protein